MFKTEFLIKKIDKKAKKYNQDLSMKVKVFRLSFRRMLLNIHKRFSDFTFFSIKWSKLMQHVKKYSKLLKNNIFKLWFELGFLKKFIYMFIELSLKIKQISTFLF